MCVDYSVTVAERVLKLQQIQVSALEKPVFSIGLCYCKKKILSNYITSMSNLIMNISTVLHMCDETSHISHWVEDRLNQFIHKFKQDAYNDLYKETELSAKFLILFEKLQQPLESDLFQMVIKDIKFASSVTNGRRGLAYRYVLDKIQTTCEFAIFNLSGLKLACGNIREEILDEKDHLNIVCPNFCYEMPETHCSACNAKECSLHYHVANTEEVLHLFMVEEADKIDCWLTNYLETIRRYHKNPEKIKIIVDWKLMDKFEWDSVKDERCSYISSMYNSIEFINYKDIDFGGYQDKFKDLGYIK